MPGTTEPRKVGRPRTSADGGKRDRKVVVYVSEGEQEQLREAANRKGQPYSAYTRSALLSTATSDLTDES